MYALPSLLVSDCKNFSSLIQYLQDTFAKKKKKIRYKYNSTVQHVCVHLFRYRITVQHTRVIFFCNKYDRTV